MDNLKQYANLYNKLEARMAGQGMEYGMDYRTMNHHAEMQEMRLLVIDNPGLFTVAHDRAFQIAR